MHKYDRNGYKLRTRILILTEQVSLWHTLVVYKHNTFSVFSWRFGVVNRMISGRVQQVVEPIMSDSLFMWRAISERDSGLKGPGSSLEWGHFCCVFGHATWLSQWLYPLRCINGYQQILCCGGKPWDRLTFQIVGEYFYLFHATETAEKRQPNELLGLNVHLTMAMITSDFSWWLLHTSVYRLSIFWMTRTINSSTELQMEVWQVA